PPEQNDHADYAGKDSEHHDGRSLIDWPRHWRRRNRKGFNVRFDLRLRLPRRLGHEGDAEKENAMEQKKRNEEGPDRAFDIKPEREQSQPLACDDLLLRFSTSREDHAPNDSLIDDFEADLAGGGGDEAEAGFVGARVEIV